MSYSGSDFIQDLVPLTADLPELEPELYAQWGIEPDDEEDLRPDAEKICRALAQRLELIEVLEKILPVACDGVTARDAYAVCEADQEHAEHGQHIVECARKLLKECSA